MAQRDTSNDLNWTKSEVLEFMKTNSFTIDSLAEFLGMHRNGVMYWTTGERKIPEPMARLMNYFDQYPEQRSRF